MNPPDHFSTAALLVFPIIWGVSLVCLLYATCRPHSSNVANSARESGEIKQWPSPPSDDPLNQEPRTVQPILFEDGYRVTTIDLHRQGLTPIIDHDGRIVIIVRMAGIGAPAKWTTEEWAGTEHGARIS